MKGFMDAQKRFWITGLVLATIGVVLVRVVSNQYDQAALRLAISGLGISLAMAGVVLIMFGIRRI